MAHSTLSLLDAAKLLQATRADIKGGRLGGHLARVSQKGKHVDAGLTKDGKLVITGSDSWQDYLFYNLRPWRPLPRMREIDQLSTPDLPKGAFHKGFLLHAARVKRFLGDQTPKFIVGHSLGAAAAQILGTGLGVPTVCLASPQVVKRKFLDKPGLRSSAHAQWNVFNLAWRQDFVTRGYRSTGLRCLGHRVVVDTKDRNFGIDHFVQDYEKLIIKAAAYKIAELPQTWPDPGFEGPTRLA
ncbi:MAG: hypothetical protein AAF678_03840 [Pseudomonadota bacterium]